MAAITTFEHIPKPQDGCLVTKLPTELRFMIWTMVLTPNDPPELVDARIRDDELRRTCQVIYDDTKKAFDEAGPTDTAYWSRGFKLTRPFHGDFLLQRVPDWSFSHITALQIRSRALTCDVHRNGNTWLGHMKWTMWNGGRKYAPWDSAYFLITETTDADPITYLTDMCQSDYEELENQGIRPTIRNDEVPAALTARGLEDILMMEDCHDLLLPMYTSAAGTASGGSINGVAAGGSLKGPVLRASAGETVSGGAMNVVKKKVVRR